MRAASALVAAAWLGAAPAAHADDAALLDYVRGLEDRIEELEENQDRLQAELDQRGSGPAAAQAATPAASSRDWSDRIRLSGSASTAWLDGEAVGPYPEGAFQIWDARLFVEADLASDVRADERVLVRDVGLLFEWDLVRLGSLQNTVGELYVDFQGVADNGWLNAQVGRFQLPIGEGYLRYSRGVAEQPFITEPLGTAWWWDEGIRLYGSAADSFVGYVASVTSGETPFNRDADSDTLTTVKLFTNPTEWLHLSVSSARSGKIGSSSTAASGAIWFGEAWARPIGAGTTVDSYVDGVVVADGPNVIEETWLLGGDVILDYQELARLWLGGGRYDVETDGPRLYDRQLVYWVAELILEGRLASRSLDRAYLGLRGSALGTYDDEEGYLLDSRYASTLGWNMSEYTAWSAVIGYRLAPGVTLRAEYTRSLVELVDGVSAAIDDAGEDVDFFGADLRLAF
jgi:hypothetical protein